MQKTIGVLTSGGDAPGMNAAVRAVTRAALVTARTAAFIPGASPPLVKTPIVFCIFLISVSV